MNWPEFQTEQFDYTNFSILPNDVNGIKKFPCSQMNNYWLIDRHSFSQWYGIFFSYIFCDVSSKLWGGWKKNVFLTLFISAYRLLYSIVLYTSSMSFGFFFLRLPFPLLHPLLSESKTIFSRNSKLFSLPKDDKKRNENNTYLPFT